MFIQVLIGAIMISSIYGLVAMGFSLIYSASGLLSFTQGELLMFGAFLGLTFYRHMQMPFFLALALTVIIMFLIGVFIESFIIRKLVRAKANMIFIVLATIALAIVLKNFSMLVWGSSVFQFPKIFDSGFVKILDVNVDPASIMAIIIAIIVMIVLHFFMNKTRFGTSMRAAAQNPLAAKTMAINVSRTVYVAWGLASALAGVAGVLISPVYGVHLEMGTMIGLKGFAAAVIGGYGNMYGAIIGSIIIGVIETFTAAYISSIYKDVISFIILIVFLILKPRGIFNAKVYDEE